MQQLTPSINVIATRIKFQIYGLTVIRLWAFNSKMPDAGGQYDESQFRSLDKIIAAAGRHNIRLILALGNSWQSYRSPEDWLLMAGLSLQNKTLLDFYTNRAVIALFKSHIVSIVNRKNTVNSLQYKNDPTIMLWNVINEPRCPGCDANEQASALQWVKVMTKHLRAQAPKQLSSAGNEGFFTGDAAVSAQQSYPGPSFNPGPWATCDNGQWSQMSSLQSIDVTTAHVLGNHMEFLPDGSFCDAPCFFQFLSSYISAHKKATESISKPFILEEFNCLIGGGYSLATRAAMFRLVSEALLDSKREGGGLAGVLFWSASMSSVWDDGYSIYLDEGISILSPPPPPRPDESPNPPLPPQPPTRSIITADKGSIDDFRMEGARKKCAEATKRGWTAAWDTRDSSGLLNLFLNKTLGLMTQAVILEAVIELGGKSGS